MIIPQEEYRWGGLFYRDLTMHLRRFPIKPITIVLQTLCRIVYGLFDDLRHFNKIIVLLFRALDTRDITNIIIYLFLNSHLPRPFFFVFFTPDLEIVFHLQAP